MGEIWHEFLHILFDPAHTLVEFTFVLIDYIIINFFYHKVIVKHLHRDVRAGKHRSK